MNPFIINRLRQKGLQDNNFIFRGSAIAKVVGNNVKTMPDEFEQEILMWVFEEDINGRKLTEIINNDHENVKYLPGQKLPENVVGSYKKYLRKKKKNIYMTKAKTMICRQNISIGVPLDLSTQTVKKVEGVYEVYRSAG